MVTVSPYYKQKNVPISEAIKNFNAKSKTFSNANNISTPQIFVGDNLDASAKEVEMGNLRVQAIKKA